jgi:hypothetical protein
MPLRKRQEVQEVLHQQRELKASHANEGGFSVRGSLQRILLYTAVTCGKKQLATARLVR